MKKVFSVILCICIAAVVSTSVFADTTVLKDTEAKEFAIENNIPVTNLAEIVIVENEETVASQEKTNSNLEILNSSASVQAVKLVTNEYVKETGVYDATSTKIIHSVTGKGEQRLSLTISESVATQVSTNFDIAFSVISAGIGFNVSKTYGVAASSYVNVPEGKWGRIDARAMLKVHNFNIYQEYIGYPTAKVGSGHASKPYGVSFTKYIY